MNRYQLEVELGRKYGRSIGWMANVINVQHSKPTRKVKGLANLAAQNRVAPGSFTMDWILIDGEAKPWSELEKYA